MKKFLILVLSLVILLSYFYVSVQLLAGNLECTDISGCGGSANCGGPGTVDGCVLDCEGGGIILCDQNGGGGLE